MKLKAFTMAEILLSLTIIGIVAAITLPSLLGNINERTWNTQRKALYARMSQAIALMPALNGMGKYSVAGSGSGATITDTAAETFVASGLAKVYKINNICTDDFKDCGISDTYNNMKGESKSMPKNLYQLNPFFELARYGTGLGTTSPVIRGSFSTYDTKAVAFETQNGESMVAYYNPKCRTEYLSEEQTTAAGGAFGFATSVMCVNFIYDLNGTKGPNTVGKDIGFITVFNSTDNIVVAPMPSSPNDTEKFNQNMAKRAQALCTLQDSESRAPNIDELSAMFINRDLIALTAHSYWSGSPAGRMKTVASGAWTNNTAWQQDNDLNGIRNSYASGDASVAPTRCIKR